MEKKVEHDVKLLYMYRDTSASRMPQIIALADKAVLR